MKKSKIAILGSTSHIAKGLISEFIKSDFSSLHLYTRTPGKVLSFLAGIGQSTDDCVVHESYSDFKKYSYDVIINCVGVGTLNKLQGDYIQYFTVTEEYDNMAIGYLRNKCPDALYISLSSGVVYGRGHSMPVDEDTANCIRVNHIIPDDYYAIVRLNAETKHRAFSGLRIIDLRLFSYFSRFIDLTDGYFITEVLDSIINKKILVTNNVNIVRDYVHPQDLFLIIRKCMDNGRINMALDVTSVKPVEKKEILDYFSLEYGLKYDMCQTLNHVSATGSKNIYYSTYNNALEIGYKPIFSSMDTIKLESKYILNKGLVK